MSKQDFMKYLSFLKEVFPKANIPSNQEIIATWYKGFQSVSLDIAKNMGEMYFQDEQNAFNYARLLQYKSKAMAGETSYDKPQVKVCEVCGGTGWVQIRFYDSKVKSEIDKYKRCNCEIGNNIRSDLSQITEDELRFLGADKIIRIEDLQYQ